MKKVLVTVLLILLILEVTMATTKNAGATIGQGRPTLNTQPQQQPRPQQGGGGNGSGNEWWKNLLNRPAAYGGQGYNPSTTTPAQINVTRPPAYNGSYNPTTSNVPAWLQSQVARPAAYGGEGYTPSNIQAQPSRPAQRPAAYGGTYNTDARNNQVPAWLQSQAARPAAYGGTYNPGNVQAQGQPVTPNDGNIYNNNTPGTTNIGTPNMGVNTFIGGGGYGVRGPQRNPRMTPIGPGTLDPSLWNMAAQGNGGGYGGGFGSKYKGNWGGGGGGGWNYGGGSSDYPAWVKTLMGLNSWNIR